MTRISLVPVLLRTDASCESPSSLYATDRAVTKVSSAMKKDAPASQTPFPATVRSGGIFRYQNAHLAKYSARPIESGPHPIFGTIDPPRTTSNSAAAYRLVIGPNADIGGEGSKFIQWTLTLFSSSTRA